MCIQRLVLSALLTSLVRYKYGWWRMRFSRAIPSDSIDCSAMLGRSVLVWLNLPVLRTWHVLDCCRIHQRRSVLVRIV